MYFSVLKERENGGIKFLNRKYLNVEESSVKRWREDPY